MDALGNPAGVIVQSVTPGGAAAKAGLPAGDVITEIDNQPVTSLADLQDVLAGLAPGTTVSVSLISQAGSKATLKVVLGQLAG